ncbi:MAG TPA: hypothetical protein VFY61_17155 [Pyrinomonadaceae bacterium]|nr:hypothetical protein [Pyrinomonadaceae bacterium]
MSSTLWQDVRYGVNEKSPVLDEMSISYPNFTDWRNHNQSFEKMGVYNRASYNSPAPAKQIAWSRARSQPMA